MASITNIPIPPTAPPAGLIEGHAWSFSDGLRVLTWSLGVQGATLTTQESQNLIESLRAAFNEWGKVIGVRFEFSPTPIDPRTSFSDIAIAFTHDDALTGGLLGGFPLDPAAADAKLGSLGLSRATYAKPE